MSPKSTGNFNSSEEIVKETETESILSKFIRVQRKIFGVEPYGSNFIVMRRKSKIINVVLTFGNAFLLFMAYMVVFKII